MAPWGFVPATMAGGQVWVLGLNLKAEGDRSLSLFARPLIIRHARYFTLQLAESYLTGDLFRQILARIERLGWHPT